ncbi:hydroxymethylpyrimidine/phosphomethylpyrimidine kinase [Brevibacterium sp. 50QC2O2]|uniref:bifunctional hydroxymethylpyrimidine kinase/phosphomethylpyrimidine kinase n=1 Tax=Brevibacterium TaxID=1696 RepID=UPI00211CE30A|nr:MULTISPECIES: hydroxymethylpyrimidine/phosphomethylpyrimidine kinase [unclassified Brevibacterium]MCQ9366757.1 hydroxymethylpyrimidine/phosphomethylpyrimidine kinase [Brevibacterium sp. 91QC2O2]MCQ9384271.1 hydroxymethylpyrimidine/phosphomethylpyrimidine kinase [Brevibacterium sp. 68QC2CO]MCQ9388890.1 hydroxymethylpyrimidine/phosphomethylpyrimidine kinase [Brevibacterium sp. 50QC2O2]
MARKALTVAGNDVTGGAGQAADLKMFEEYGVFGATVLTCIVTFHGEEGFAKDFRHAIEFLDTDLIARQLDSALSVHDFDVIKSGMLGSAESALLLAERLRDRRGRAGSLPFVFDPVLVSKGTGTMVDLGDLFVKHLVPLATVITPNLDEAAALTGADALHTPQEMAEAARAIHAMGAANVVVKGGARLDGAEALDVFYDGHEATVLASTKVNNDLVNGAGCSFASAIAAGVATGLPVDRAVFTAKEKVAHGIARALDNATGVRSLYQAAGRCEPDERISVRRL